TVVAPTPAPLDSPLVGAELLTFATAEFAEDQVADSVTSLVVPFLKFAVACNCIWVPCASDGLIGSIVMALMFDGAGPPPPPPPHACRRLPNKIGIARISKSGGRKARSTGVGVSSETVPPICRLVIRPILHPPKYSPRDLGPL